MMPRSSAVFAIGSQAKYRALTLVPLTHEGRDTVAVDQSRMKEMDHPATVRNVYPALYQRGVGFAIAVCDDPIA
jgi:hypothetical protein